MSEFKSLNGYLVKDETARLQAAANASDISALRASVINYDLMNIYVDDYYGDDTTGDGTSPKPFKSIDRALEEVNKGNININIKLMHAGTYYCHKPRFTGFTWHMSSHAAGVTVDFTEGGSVKGVVFYSMHVNWSVKDEFDQQDYYGFTVRTSGGVNGFFQDSGYCKYTRINFLNRYNCHGGETLLDTCHISSIQGDRALLDLRDIDVNSEDTMSSVIDLDYGTTCTMRGNWIIRDVIGSKTRFFRIRQSKLLCAVSSWTSEAVTLPANAIYQYQMEITSTATMKTNLLAMGAAGYEYDAPHGAGTINVWNTTENAQP